MDGPYLNLVLILELIFLIEFMTNSDYRSQMDLTFFNNSAAISSFDKNPTKEVHEYQSALYFILMHFIFIIFQLLSSRNFFSGPEIPLTKGASFPYCTVFL